MGAWLEHLTTYLVDECFCFIVAAATSVRLSDQNHDAHKLVAGWAVVVHQQLQGLHPQSGRLVVVRRLQGIAGHESLHLRCETNAVLGITQQVYREPRALYQQVACFHVPRLHNERPRLSQHAGELALSDQQQLLGNFSGRAVTHRDHSS